MSDFDKKWDSFINAFDKEFDTDSLRNKISQNVEKENPNASLEEKQFKALSVYQKIRTDNLIKNALMNLDKLTSNDD